MIRISDRWAVTGSRGDLTLTESSVRKNPKSGEPTVSKKSSFHPTLEQCLNKVVNAEIARYAEGDQCQGSVDAARNFNKLLETLRAEIKEIANAAQAAVPTDGE